MPPNAPVHRSPQSVMLDPPLQLRPTPPARPLDYAMIQNIDFLMQNGSFDSLVERWQTRTTPMVVAQPIAIGTERRDTRAVNQSQPMQLVHGHSPLNPHFISARTNGQQQRQPQPRPQPQTISPEHNDDWQQHVQAAFEASNQALLRQQQNTRAGRSGNTQVPPVVRMRLVHSACNESSRVMSPPQNPNPYTLPRDIRARKILKEDGWATDREIEIWKRMGKHRRTPWTSPTLAIQFNQQRAREHIHRDHISKLEADLDC